MKNNFSFIFLGLTHGFVNDFDKQRELIEEVNPDIVLSEEMENISLLADNEYDNFIEAGKHSFMTPFSEVESLARLCRKKNIKLVGIDFENFGFSREVGEKIKNNGTFSKEEEAEVGDLVLKRETHQLSKIKEYLGKSKKTILVFLGSWYLRDDSPILKEISNSKLIFPANKNGDLVFEPTEDILYGEKEI